MRGRAVYFSIAVALAAQGLAVTVAFPGPASADDPVAQCTKLAVIGDSLTYGSAATLAAELMASGIYDFALDAVPGRMIRSTAKKSGVRTLRDLRKKGYTPDCFVVALGTNDIGLTGNVATYETWIDEMMTEIGEHPVLWVNVARVAPAGRDVLFNATLVSRQTVWPNLLIGDWATVMASHQEWFGFDKIHLKRAGYLARAAWLAGQVLDHLYTVAPPLDLPACTITKRLRPGTRSAEVVCLETRLEQLGFPMPGGPDQKFDSATYRALARFQHWHWLAPTGSTGPATLSALGFGAP